MRCLRIKLPHILISLRIWGSFISKEIDNLEENISMAKHDADYE